MASLALGEFCDLVFSEDVLPMLIFQGAEVDLVQNKEGGATASNSQGRGRKGRSRRAGVSRMRAALTLLVQERL